ncbi:hypothetical protein Pedsa_0102 [Pseudopedobacter saltans DSM 12145]|uniref:Uncharacterized protein n=1 Tax=Pseudopedobacter saltans (strain ATCC 51119 / DSM 12145 / JCM 21818 / CCUG 39354 / LMG 10337 / NBRC 100064 / NCIMB 13643) TaxID=762903 RepID=F0SCU9_PSESL|nr:hypothetical protein [Pseudopedobacter saltans]ADY50688.1 hypothetical protein Pedsa_0102 [Pseudopedobacter saltans DSM 12145]
MRNKATKKDNSYLPVAWEYRETIEEQISKKSTGKIFYFGEDNQIEEAQGTVLEMKEQKNAGVFIFMDMGLRIRIDRIITLFGKIGAAYDEYDAYSNACMDCMGGYTREELEEE